MRFCKNSVAVCGWLAMGLVTKTLFFYTSAGIHIVSLKVNILSTVMASGAASRVSHASARP